MGYQIYVLNGLERDLFGPEIFADERSAIAFGLEYVPEDLDFETVETSAQFIDIPQDAGAKVISLCAYRESKREKTKQAI